MNLNLISYITCLLDFSFGQPPIICGQFSMKCPVAINDKFYHITTSHLCCYLNVIGNRYPYTSSLESATTASNKNYFITRYHISHIICCDLKRLCLKIICSVPTFQLQLCCFSLRCCCHLLVSEGYLCDLPAGFALSNNLVTLLYIVTKDVTELQLMFMWHHDVT